MHQIEEKFGNSVVERGSKSKNKSWKNIEEIAKKKKKNTIIWLLKNIAKR